MCGLTFKAVDLDDAVQLHLCATLRQATYTASNSDTDSFVRRWPTLDVYRKRLLKYQAQCRDYVALVYREKENVGHYIVTSHYEDDRCGWVEVLYLHREYRGQRLGEVILGHIENLLRNKGYNRVATTSHLLRSKVTEFYRSCGWQQTGDDGQSPPLIFWEKRL